MNNSPARLASFLWWCRRAMILDGGAVRVGLMFAHLGALTTPGFIVVDEHASSTYGLSRSTISRGLREFARFGLIRVVRRRPKAFVLILDPETQR